MPPPKYLQSDYFGAMDRPSYFKTLDEQAPIHHQTPHNASSGANTGLTPHELGTTLNPMENQLSALQAKIREGASKIEFEFLGQGKGNSQQSTPESYGKEEREMMRKIAQLNNIKSSTHATPSVQGLAGLGERGFDKRAQHRTIEEVQRAIDFAKDASTGGAVVVHAGEWQRPVSPYYGDEGREEQMGFSAYDKEDEKAQMLVVDSETGQFISQISKDRVIDVPEWQTAQSLGEQRGENYAGKGVDVNGKPVEIKPDDYVDLEGRKIDKTDPTQLFRRVPVYEEDKGDIKFKTQKLKWPELAKEAKDAGIEPEKYFAQLTLDNQILESKGGSLFHLQYYKRNKEQYEKLREAKRIYDALQEDLSEEERLAYQQKLPSQLEQFGIPSESKNISEQIEDEMKRLELSMRHTHQSSSSADTRVSEFERRRKNLQTIEEYGLEQTGEALGRLAEEAMIKSREARKKRSPDEQWEDLYIAPENWDKNTYGSHPQELLRMVQKGREKFEETLKNKHQITDAKKREELAKKHIKTTFDIGHLNMWRSMLKKENPNETDEQLQKRFNKWVFKHLEELHDAEAIGHLHLTDNFGYNDEHLHIGQGNAPVKEFVEWMQERGYKDFIIEPGSFNPTTIMPDAWSYLGAAPQRKFGPSGGWRSQRMAQAGLYQNPNYIVGSYVPSNEWTLWSGVPLE